MAINTSGSSLIFIDQILTSYFYVSTSVFHYQRTQWREKFINRNLNSISKIIIDSFRVNLRFLRKKRKLNLNRPFRPFFNFHPRREREIIVKYLTNSFSIILISLCQLFQTDSLLVSNTDSNINGGE